MVQAGVIPAKALVAATKTGAACLGQKLLGSVETGNKADVVIVNGNPLDDIRNTRKIEVVIKEGQLSDRERLLSEIMNS